MLAAQRLCGSVRAAGDAYIRAIGPLCGVTDRSGDKKFYEVYPAGSLIQWGLTSKG